MRVRSRRPGAWLPPVVVIAVLAGCGGPSIPAEWTLELEPLLVLGGADAPPEAAFYRPRAIAADGAGSIHVLDAGNHRVQVFGADGEFLRSLGREGAGPAELSRPEGLWVFPDGEIVVADTGNARLVRWGPSGEPLAPIPLDFLPLDVVGTGDRLWVLRLPPPALVAGSDPTPLVHELDRDGNVVGTAVAPQPADIGLIYFLQNALRIAPSPDGGFALADTHVRSRIRLHDSEGLEGATIPVLYKAEGWAPLGTVPRRVDDVSLQGVARTATDLAWDERRSLYWVLSGYVDRDPDGTWVVARELYRYDVAGSYRGSVVLSFSAHAVAAARDGAIWLLDSSGAVRRMRLHDPEGIEPPPAGRGVAQSGSRGSSDQ